MGELGLNLSTRPFPAYRAANLGMLVVLIILIGVSAWQGYSYVHYTALAAGIRAEERAISAEAEGLKAKSSQLQATLDRPDAAAKLTEIDYLNNLIIRKSFSWTRVFAVLERMIPVGVHLTSLRPDVTEDGKLLLHIDVRGRNIVDISDFIDLLEKSDVFENVVPHVEEKTDAAALKGEAAPRGEVNVSLTMTYVPQSELQ